jgi:hypothetical protein
MHRAAELAIRVVYVIAQIVLLGCIILTHIVTVTIIQDGHIGAGIFLIIICLLMDIVWLIKYAIIFDDLFVSGRRRRL